MDTLEVVKDVKLDTGVQTATSHATRGAVKMVVDRQQEHVTIVLLESGGNSAQKIAVKIVRMRCVAKSLVVVIDAMKENMENSVIKLVLGITA